MKYLNWSRYKLIHLILDSNRSMLYIYKIVKANHQLNLASLSIKYDLWIIKDSLLHKISKANSNILDDHYVEILSFFQKPIIGNLFTLIGDYIHCDLLYTFTLTLKISRWSLCELSKLVLWQKTLYKLPFFLQMMEKY